MAKLFANTGDPDQMLHSAASDLSLHCLPTTLSGVSDYNGLVIIFHQQVSNSFSIAFTQNNPDDTLKLFLVTTRGNCINFPFIFMSHYYHSDIIQFSPLTC